MGAAVPRPRGARGVGRGPGVSVNGYVVDAAGVVVFADRSQSVHLAAHLEKQKTHFTNVREVFDLVMPLKIHRCTQRHDVGTVIDTNHD